MASFASFETTSQPFTSHYIDGKHKPSSTNATYEVRNPLANKVVGRAASASSQDCRDAIEAAAKAFTTWEHSDYGFRRDIFLKAADLLLTDKYRTKIIDTITEETAGTTDWGLVNWGMSAPALKTAAGMVNELKGETFPSITGGHVVVQRRAIGPVLSIAPWNAPFILTLRAVAVPIICGNTVVLKPSEYSPRCQAIVAELFEEAGLPSGVLNFVSMSRETSPALTAEIIGHPKIRAINFTGSDRVGRLIAAEAAKYLKPCVFELGGKAPMIVMDDANLEDAARAVVFGAFAHSGQVCMATERIIVQRGISKPLIESVTALVRNLKAGDPTKNALSPLFTEGSAGNVLNLIREAQDGGAELLLGDLRRDGSIVQPHLLAGVKPGMRIWEEETFGPVTVFAVFDSIDDGVDMANDTDYSLSASVFTRDVHAAVNIASRIRSEYTNINGTTFHSEPFLPAFGLGGSSGYGCFDVESFTQKRSIVFHPPNRQYQYFDNMQERPRL